MKTLNSKKVSVLSDEDGNSVGFAGMVQVYDKSIYVDTRDGTGYDEVIKKLEPLIYKFALKYSFNGNIIDDTRQDIVIHILEGIPKYNPNKNMKLSSFLQMRIDRRLINDLRNKNRSSKNATFLNITNYSISCDCGHTFAITIHNDEQFVICPDCGKNIGCDGKKNAVNIFEVNESMLDSHSDDIGSACIGDFRASHNAFADKVIKNKDIEKWLKNEDPKIVKIIELICLHDYSIATAAKEVGLTGAGANLKLRSLKRKKMVRDLFDR